MFLCLFYFSGPPRVLHSFPTRRSSDLSIAESIDRFKPVLARAKADGVRVRGYISTVLGCPYEGEIKPQAVVDVAKVLWDLRSEEHTSELQSHHDLVCRLLLEKKKKSKS